MPDPPPYFGAGSAEVSTLLVGAGCGRTEPVTSGAACGLEASGVSMKRSLLQPAMPAEMTASSARRDTARERDGSTNLDMGQLTQTQQLTSELNTEAVNRALSL